MHTNRTEPQPHIFGANAGQFRSGIAVVNGDTPPSWEPSMAYHKDYPYNVEEFAGDLVRWQAATKVALAGQSVENANRA